MRGVVGLRVQDDRCVERPALCRSPSQCRVVNALPCSQLSVSSLSWQVRSMITVYLRVYRPQNFRNKQNYRDHGASRETGGHQSAHRPQGNRALPLKLTDHCGKQVRSRRRRAGGHPCGRRTRTVSTATSGVRRREVKSRDRYRNGPAPPRMVAVPHEMQFVRKAENNAF